jgi:hypothetical protein
MSVPFWKCGVGQNIGDEEALVKQYFIDTSSTVPHQFAAEFQRALSQKNAVISQSWCL